MLFLCATGSPIKVVHTEHYKSRKRDKQSPHVLSFWWAWDLISYIHLYKHWINSSHFPSIWWTWDFHTFTFKHWNIDYIHLTFRLPDEREIFIHSHLNIEILITFISISVFLMSERLWYIHLTVRLSDVSWDFLGVALILHCGCWRVGGGGAGLFQRGVSLQICANYSACTYRTPPLAPRDNYAKRWHTDRRR